VVITLIIIAVVLVFGVFPALKLAGLRIGSVLKEGGRGVVAGSRGRLQSGLIIGEIGLALMLLTGAGLLVRSFTKLVSVSPGFDAQHALAMDLSIPNTKYPNADAKAAFVQRVVDRVSTIPGWRVPATRGRPMQGIEAMRPH
jgi:putative ABC transport system permease protein